jgi:hypothetical protein
LQHPKALNLRSRYQQKIRRCWRISIRTARKLRQRKRIETEYGEKGKKAVFVENNINEILKEAEESGKVTKQCP